jgi:hypothetical protein
MTKQAFATLRFGDWSRILVGQINRKHYYFAVDTVLRQFSRGRHVFLPARAHTRVRATERCLPRYDSAGPAPDPFEASAVAA